MSKVLRVVDLVTNETLKVTIDMASTVADLKRSAGLELSRTLKVGSEVYENNVVLNTIAKILTTRIVVIIPSQGGET